MSQAQPVGSRGCEGAEVEPVETVVEKGSRHARTERWSGVLDTLEPNGGGGI